MARYNRLLLCKTEQALNEAIDALGDILAEDVTEQQREAYRLCMDVRENVKGEEE